MSAILYPVADTAEAALHTPRGFAARAREAELLADSPVDFVTEAVGPAFVTREAALEAYCERRTSRREAATIRLATRGVKLTPVAAPQGQRSAARSPVRPTYANGRRWPEPEASAAVLWRLSVSFWRLREKIEAPPLDAARQMRREEAGRELRGPVLSALARQPMRAVKPQQPLDIGLFETRPPEAPDTIIADE